MAAGQHTLREIMSQPEVWSHAIDAFAAKRSSVSSLLNSADFDQIIVTGCGSTYYLALTASRLLRRAGVDALACPASELLLHPYSICPAGRRYLLLTVSRSGTTTETVRAQQIFKSVSGGAVVTVTCDSGSPLAQEADLAIAIYEAQEESVAQTRSFCSMAVVLQLLAATLAGHDLGDAERLPVDCRKLMENHAVLAQSLGENRAINKFFFLGSDALYGIACEAMLKMKEMSLAYSEAFHTLEFRHGPMSMVGADSLVIGLITPASSRHEIRVLQEMADMGATILAIGQTPTDMEYHVALPADLPTWSTPILYLPVLQLLAYHRAIFNGCDPDQPAHLSAVIALDDI